MKHRLLNFLMKKLKLLLVVLGIVLMANTVIAQDPVVVAGGVDQPTWLPQAGADAYQIGRAAMLRVDSEGNYYYVDYYQGLGIMKMDTDGIISVFVKDDNNQDYGFGGPRAMASVNNRGQGIEIDCDDNVYFSNRDGIYFVDMATDYLYKIYDAGDPIVSPAGLAFNEDCSILYINDLSNKGNAIYAMDMGTHELTRIAGTTARTESGFGMLAINTPTREPYGLDYIKDGDVEYLYVCTQQKYVYRINMNTGVKEHLAGNGGWGYSGDGGLGVDAKLKQPHDIVVAPDNKAVYFGDHQASTLRKVDLNTMLIDAIVNKGNTRYRGADALAPDGPGIDFPANRIIGVDWDLDGNLLFTERGDEFYSFIRKYDMTSLEVSTLAGAGDQPTPQPVDGFMASELWKTSLYARGVAEDADGMVYVSDNKYDLIRMIDKNGMIHTVAGEADSNKFTGGGAFDTVNFSSPQQMLLKDDTLLYLADDGHDVIYQIDLKNEMVKVVVGTGSGGYTESGGMGDTTKIKDPRGIAFWGDTLYWVERGNHIARKMTPDGMVHHVAGVPGSRAGNAGEELGPAVDGAKFRNLTGISVDDNGNVYIGGDRNHYIRKLDIATGEVVEWGTYMGNPLRFSRPYGQFFAAGLVWVADNGKLYTVDPVTEEATLFSDAVPGATNVAAGPSGVWVTGYNNGLFLFGDATDALDQIDAMAKADDASMLSTALLETAGADMVMGGWLDIYRDTVAGAPSVPRLDTLQFMVDTVNALEAIQILDTYAADTTGMADVYLWVLTQTENLIVENAPEYVDSLLAKSDDGTTTIGFTELQALVDEVNANSADAALDTIDGMAVANDASTLTYELLVQAGVEGVKGGDMVYCMAYRDSVAAQDGFATLGELQTKIDEANAAQALAHIKWMADNNVDILTLADLENASGQAPVEDNLMPYKWALADTGGAAIVDAGDVEALQDAVDFEVSQLMVIAGMVDADTSTLDSTLLADAGAMFDPDLLQVYKAFIADDTLEDGTAKMWKYKSDLQAVIDAADAKVAADDAAAATAAALAAIQGYADADDASAMTVEELETAGAMIACGDANLDLYKAWVADTTGTFIANADSLQWLIDTADDEGFVATLDVIDGLARAGDASVLETFHLCVTEITGVDDALIAAYRDSVGAADSIITQADLQAIIDEVNTEAERLAEEAAKAAILAAIQGFADADDASGLWLYHLEDLELTDIMYEDEYLPAYRAAVEDSTAATIPDIAALQALVTAVNTEVGAAVIDDALAAIDAMAVASDASALTRALLIDALSGDALLKNSVRHFELYQDSIAGADSVKTVAALEAIIASANMQKAIEVVQDFATAGDASGMTAANLVEAGVDPATILTYNLEAYQDSVAGAAAADVATTAKIQALVDEVNTMEYDNALATILAMTVAGDASGLTTALLKKAEFEYEADYLEAYQEALSAVGALTTKAEVQEELDFTTLWESIKDMPGSGDVENLTIADAEEVGATNLFADFIEEYRYAVYDADSIVDLADFQAIIDGANLQTVLDMPLYSDASRLTEEILTTIGCTDVRTENMEAYKTAIEDEPLALADLAALQAIIDAVNVISVEDIFANDNLNVYPIPTNGRLFIDLRQIPAEGVDVEVTDITGRVVMRTKLTDSRSVIDITGESSGVYFLKLSVDDNVVTKRIMLQ